MKKSKIFLPLLCLGVVFIFYGCSGTVESYSAITDKIDPASINKSYFQAYLPFESGQFAIIKGKGIDSINVSVGTKVKFVAGQRGYAFQGKDSVSSYIQLPLLSSNLFRSFSSFTITSWIKTVIPVNNKTAQIYLVNGGDIINGNLSLSIDSLYLNGYIYNSATSLKPHTIKLDRSKIKNDEWTHVAFSYNDSTSKMTVYFNGNFAQENICYADSASTTKMGNLVLGVDMTKLIIGAWPQQIAGKPTNTMSYFGGMIDELRIWNKALTTSQVTQVYNAELGLKNK
ncbi:MAG: LamG domain-containing protein [Paludibacter sp.]